MNTLLILDFDGTLTNAEEEEKTTAKDILKMLLSLPTSHQKPLFPGQKNLKTILNMPTVWRINEIVAPLCRSLSRIMPIST